MRVNKRTIKKWTGVLRSGEYQQTKNKLQDSNGFCCLGVACHMFIATPLLDGDGHLIGTVPELQAAAPKWLKEINEDFQKLAGIGLSQLNDLSMGNMTPGNGTDYAYTEIDRLTFDEIADLIEAVYLHRVLD